MQLRQHYDSFQHGDSVTILNCQWPHMVGRRATIGVSDHDTKLKVNFEDGHVGYYEPQQLVHDEDWWQLELLNVGNCPVRTDSVADQLRDLVAIATKFGLHAAARRIQQQL